MAPQIRPRKRLGQNFLNDPNIARKIVDAVRADANALVVEIGAGTGALTGLLSERFERLVAVEVDPRAVAVLRETFPGVEVVEADVLDVGWSEYAAERGADGALYAVGNLPYYITSQILISLLEARGVVREAVLMMQLEVAERLAAPPGSRTYGILSVLLQQFADVELLFRVSRNVFYPRPDVTSAVIRVTFREEDPENSDVDFEAFRAVVRTAFNQRRKTLRNSLAGILKERGVALPEPWSGQRAEELSPAEFVSLTRYIQVNTVRR